MANDLANRSSRTTTTLLLMGAAIGGYMLAPREMLDSQVRHTGFFQTDTTRTLSAAVESLKAQSSLVVFSFRGSASVRAERSWLWIFAGEQDLIVPAVVDFRIDLSSLTMKDVSFDAAAKVVTVHLPKLQLGDIALQPEQVWLANQGILSLSQQEVEELTRENYLNARRSIIKQAQSPGMVTIAQRHAIDAVNAAFETPLRIAGMTDVRVESTFT